MKKIVFIFGILFLAFFKSLDCSASDTVALFDCHKAMHTGSLHAPVQFNFPVTTVVRIHSNDDNTLSVSDVETKEVDGKECVCKKVSASSLFFPFIFPIIPNQPALKTSSHFNFQRKSGALRCATTGNFRI